MNSKRHKAELWEIQGILYLILAQLIATDWIMWIVRGYGIFSLLSAIAAGISSEMQDRYQIKQQ